MSTINHTQYDEPYDGSEYDSDDDTDEIIPYIQHVNQKWRNRRSQSNYTPFRTPRNDNRHEWHVAYQQQLMDMYQIITNIMNERYPKNKIKWETNDQIFHNLSRLLYHCSSKYISPYIEYPWNENKSKELNVDSKDGESKSHVKRSQPGALRTGISSQNKWKDIKGSRGSRGFRYSRDHR